MLAKFVRLFDQLKRKEKKTMPNAREPGENVFKKCEGSNVGVGGLGELNKNKTKRKQQQSQCKRARREHLSYVSLGGCVLSESYFICRPTGDVVVVSAAYGIGVSNRTIERDLATISLAKFLPYCSANCL